MVMAASTVSMLVLLRQPTTAGTPSLSMMSRANCGSVKQEFRGASQSPTHTREHDTHTRQSTRTGAQIAEAGDGKLVQGSLLWWFRQGIEEQVHNVEAPQVVIVDWVVCKVG